MSKIQVLLKLNAINCLLFGALFVFFPFQIIDFLSDSSPMPKLIMVLLGMGLNIYGLLLVWMSNKNEVPLLLVLLVSIGDFLWVMATVVLLLMKVWVNSSNGIAVAGLVAMLVGYFGWMQLRYYLENK